MGFNVPSHQPEGKVLNSNFSVDANRLISDLETLGQIGRTPGGGLRRSSFSSADTEARNWYIGRCNEAGLTVKVDGLRNLIVSSPNIADHIAGRPAVWSGSHIDTVPNGGRFDGALGAIAALECLRRIDEERIPLARPVCSVVFTDEEGCYANLLGSSALVTDFSLAELEAMTGRDGDRFVDTFVAAGGRLREATQTKIDPSMLHAMVELHIEQGPVLERLGHQIGVVTGIVGLGGGSITFEGRPDHAGTMPMTSRKDALIAAAALIVEFPVLAARAGPDAVITSGMIRVEPGSANVVPEFTCFSVDFRHPDLNQMLALEAEITSMAYFIGKQYGVGVRVDLGKTIPPVVLDHGIQKIITTAAGARGLSSSSLPSGAGHDSQNMAMLVPTGMIFVPSISGRSHCPEEDTSCSDVKDGANVLLDTLVRLAT